MTDHGPDLIDGPAVLIAQLTDTHVRSHETTCTSFVDNNARLAEAVSSLNAESPRPAAVVATGDLTEEARASEFAELGSLFDLLAAPVLLPLPGNHDERAQLRALFPDVPWTGGGHLSWDVAVQGVRLVGLDTIRPGEHGGEFDSERERWLRDRLADRHGGVTILAMHHPPFATGISWMDRAGFVGLDRLARVLADHPVDRIICGHLHRPITSAIAGIPVQVGLSTVQNVALDLAVDAEPMIIHDPAGYQLHLVADGRVVTHTRYIATGEKPSPAGFSVEAPR